MLSILPVKFVKPLNLKFVLAALATKYCVNVPLLLSLLDSRRFYADPPLKIGEGIFMGKTIGIVSLKGGVGKTSVVTALGAALSEFGKEVLLIDGNLSSPSLGLHLNITGPETTIHHVLNRTANTKDAIYEYEGFHVMPASIFSKIEINFSPD